MYSYGVGAKATLTPAWIPEYLCDIHTREGGPKCRLETGWPRGVSRVLWMRSPSLGSEDASFRKTRVLCAFYSAFPILQIRPELLCAKGGSMHWGLIGRR